MSKATLKTLASETLDAEKQRVMVLLIIASALALFSLVPPSYLGPYFERVFHGRTDDFMLWRFFVLGGLVCCLVAERLLLTYLIKRVPTAYRYITALFETSAPTAGMIVAATFADAASPISEVPVFIYPLFIVLSAMRLSFALSLFTGAVACVLTYLKLLDYLKLSDSPHKSTVTAMPHDVRRARSQRCSRFGYAA